jgi:hypothetical protein
MMINATFGDGDYHQTQFNALSYGSREEDAVAPMSDAA